MGLFSRSTKVPQLDLTKTREAVENIEGFGDAFGRSEERAGRIAPLALGARESALGDLARGTEFFEEFQPTSLEEALAQQTFQNIFPDVERSIKQNLSLSGIASSPILAQQIGRARGELGVDIGNILAQLGQRRAESSLQGRLNIDPFRDVLLPQTAQDLAQSNLRQNALAELAFIDAQESLRSRVGKQRNRSELFRNITRLAGPLPALFSGEGGAALAGFTDNINTIGNLFGAGNIGGTPFQSQQGQPQQGQPQPVFRSQRQPLSSSNIDFSNFGF